MSASELVLTEIIAGNPWSSTERVKRHQPQQHNQRQQHEHHQQRQQHAACPTRQQHFGKECCIKIILRVKNTSHF